MISSRSSHSKTRLAAVAGLAAVALLAAACGSDGTSLAAGSNGGDGDGAVTSPENPDTPVDNGDNGTPVQGSSQDYIGLAVDDAHGRADDDGRPSRVVREDGEDLAGVGAASAKTAASDTAAAAKGTIMKPA